MDWTTVGSSTGIAGAIVAVVKLVESARRGPTDRSATQRADDAEEELVKAISRIKLLDETIGKRDETIKRLERETNLGPILELQAQVLDKLTAMNGSLGAVKAGLDESAKGLAAATEAIKLVASQVMLHGLERAS